MDKRTATALVVTLLVLMIWYWFVLPKLVRKPEVPPEEVSEVTPVPSGVPGEKPSEWEEAVIAEAAPGEAASPSPTPEVTVEPELITLETAALRASFSTAGGSIEEMVLKEYLDSARENPFVLLRPLTEAESDTKIRSLAIAEPSEGMRLAERPFEVVYQTDRGIKFRAGLGNRLVMTKKYELAEEDPEGLLNYHVNLAVELENPTDEVVEMEYYEVFSGVGVSPEVTGRRGYRRAGYYLQAVVGKETGKGLRVEKKKPKPGEVETVSDAPVKWAGTRIQYFASILEPADTGGAPFVRQAVVRNMEGTYVSSLRTRRLVIRPHESVVHNYRLFVGPLKTKALRAYGEYEKVITYGWCLPAPIIEPISKVLLWLLHIFYGVMKNYGVSIIVLTVLIRVVLFPLSRKQALSMHKMQKMSPLISELKEKYKSNRKKMNEEMMKLYKEQGVNPAAGCLPMFLQFPVLIAMYSGLSQAIELRQAPFVLWIKDLSQPDALFNFPFSFLGISSLNILPLIMIGAMVFQQKLFAQPAVDQQQSQMQMMTKFMPIIFGFFFYSMPSGLVLYWTTSTTYGVAEQVLIRRHLKALEERGEALKAFAPPTSKEGPKKRKFKPRGTK